MEAERHAFDDKGSIPTKKEARQVPTPTAGSIVHPGEGRLLSGGSVEATIKVAGGRGVTATTFEVTIAPGFDVGAHYHTHREELFFVVEGTLDMMAFEPAERPEADWRSWVAADQSTFVRGKPGTLMHVPPGVPHAIANHSDSPVTVLFQSAPEGHEEFMEELLTLLRESSTPDPAAISDLRRRHGIVQLTDLSTPIEPDDIRREPPVEVGRTGKD